MGKTLKWTAGSLAALTVIGLIAPDEESAPEPEPTEPTATATATATPTPASPREQVEDAVADAVEGAEVTDMLRDHGVTYTVEFPVNTDHFTSDLILKVAEDDTKAIVQAVVETGVPVRSVVVQGVADDMPAITTAWEAALTQVDWSDDTTVDNLITERAADTYGTVIK